MPAVEAPRDLEEVLHTHCGSGTKPRRGGAGRRPGVVLKTMQEGRRPSQLGPQVTALGKCLEEELCEKSLILK